MSWPALTLVHCLLRPLQRFSDVVGLLVLCALVATFADASGFLHWAFESQVKQVFNSSDSLSSQPLAFTAQTTSAFSDIVVVVARINSTDGAQPNNPDTAQHPFAERGTRATAMYVAYMFASFQYDQTLITDYPDASLTTPWDSVTILHYATTESNDTDGTSSDITVDKLCGKAPSTNYCGILLAVTTNKSLSSTPFSRPSTPDAGVTPFVWFQNAVPRRRFIGSPDVLTVTYIPLIPTVDANNRALEGVVPWMCGVTTENVSSDSGSMDCTITSPEESTPMHRGCNPPLGSLLHSNVSTTVALTWNGTVYLFRPLEFAVRTLSCLSPDIETTPPHCYNFSDLIYVVPKGAAWGFLQMTYPQSAQPPPWIILDATPLVLSQCLLYVSGTDSDSSGVTLYNMGASPSGGPMVSAGTLIPEGAANRHRNCTPSITTTVLDLIFSVNITGEFSELGCGLTDGLFSTASTVFTTLCGGIADFYVASPTVGYMQQTLSSRPFVLLHAGSIEVPFPDGFAGMNSSNEFAVSVTRHGTLTRMRKDSSISKAAYNTLATSSMYTIALAVPSTGYRSASPWAKANNVNYGDERDSYVSVVTAMSSYVLGFEATIGSGDSGGNILGKNFSLVHTVVKSVFYSILDVQGTDTTIALLNPKDYYASANATLEFCQYGPCEWAVPVRDRITAVLGFSQLQQLPPVAESELLSAEIVLGIACRGTLPFEAQSTAALISIHREMVNATASWLLREATAVSVLTLMVSASLNVSDGRSVGFKELNLYSARMDGNISATAKIPDGTLSIYGGTSFVQPSGMIDPYDGIIGDISARGRSASNIWHNADLDPETLKRRIYSEQLTAADLFPIRIPALSSQAVAVENFTGRFPDFQQPQVVISFFMHSMRTLATVPRTTFYPTASSNSTVGVFDLPVSTTCLYLLNDNGAPSATSQGATLDTFIRYTKNNRSDIFARWLYANSSAVLFVSSSILNEASYIQLHMGNSRYGTQRINTQVVLDTTTISPPNAAVAPGIKCSSADDGGWTFSISVSYGVLSTGGDATVVSGPTVASSGTILNGEIHVTQSLLPLYVMVGGAVGVTQSYCSQAPLTRLSSDGGHLSPNTTLLSIATQMGATSTGVLYSEQVTSTALLQMGNNDTLLVATAASLNVAFSAASVAGSASFQLLQPFGNLLYPTQWTASDRHASRVSGGNVTSMSVPFGSDGTAFVCQGTIVMVMSPHGTSKFNDISVGRNASDTNIPCPPMQAACTCLPSSVQASADATVAFVSFVYKGHFNASLEETLVVFFNFTDASVLGWVTPPTIRKQMGGLCPTTTFPTVPFVFPQLTELPLTGLQTTIAQVRAAQAEYTNDNSTIEGDDIIAGLITAIPGTRCLVVWVATRNAANSGSSHLLGGTSSSSSVQTFVFTSLSHMSASFTGAVNAFSGSPFITISQSIPCSDRPSHNVFCGSAPLLSVQLVDLAEAIVSSYKKIDDGGSSLSNRYDYPFAIVPGVVNSSVLTLITAGQFRITIQGLPANGADLDVNGCRFNASEPCVANYSTMVALVSDLYSDATAPPLYEIDLIACHTVPRYPNQTYSTLLHLPINGTCRLLYNETRRNVILTDPRQSISAYRFLGDYVCVAFGSVVCFQLAPVPNVTSATLAGIFFQMGPINYVFDLFFGTPVTSFSSMLAVFNSPGRVPMSLNFPSPAGQPTFSYLQPTTASSSEVGTNYSDCDTFVLSDSVLTLMCARFGAATSKRMTMVDAISLSVIVESGPYGFAGTAPVISTDGTYIVFINNMLTLSVTFLNVRYVTWYLSLTCTVCGVVGDASYTINFKSSLSTFEGAAEVVLTSQQPNVPVVRRSLGNAILAPGLYFFEFAIGSNFVLNEYDAATLFTDLLPNGGSTDMYAYIVQITDTVTLIQHAKQSTTAPSQRRQHQQLESTVRIREEDIPDASLLGLFDLRNASMSPSVMAIAPSYKYSSASCYACIVVDAFSTSTATGQCPSVCAVDTITNSQLRYTSHKGAMLRQTKTAAAATFSAVNSPGSTNLIFTELHDPNSTLVNAHYLYRHRASQDIVPCAEGVSSISVPLSVTQTFCVDLLADVSRYRDVVSVNVVPNNGFVAVARQLSMSDEEGAVAGLITTLQYVSMRPVVTVETHASLLHPLAMAIGVQVLPIQSTDSYATIQSATIADGTLSIVVGDVERQLTNCSPGSLMTSALLGPPPLVCDSSNPRVGVIGGEGSLPQPSGSYLAIQWSSSSQSLWGSGYVRARHPLPLTYLLHRAPSMSSEERNMLVPPLDVLYTSMDGGGVGNQWSQQDAGSCQALPAGAPSHDGNLSAGGMTFNWDAAMPPPVVCPTKCTPDYASCGSLAQHFFDSYLFYTTHITGQPYVLPVGPLTQPCWDSMPDVSRFQLAAGYFQQADIVSDWAFGRIAQVELYCTAGGQVAITATIPKFSLSTGQYTYNNANERVLLRLMKSSNYDAGLGITLTCTHCMYFMLDGVSAQPFLVMLIGSVKGLLLCYLFYFIGRVAERKKRQRMMYIVARGDLMDRLDAIKWIVGMRRVERRAESDEPISFIRECAASLRERERQSAADEGLFAMSTAELAAEKRKIHNQIGQVDAAYYRKHARASRLSRFLHRVMPNPIDLAIFLLLWLLRFRKQEDVIRVRKVIARTFSSATLSRKELAMHLGAILSAGEYRPLWSLTPHPSSPQQSSPLLEGFLPSSVSSAMSVPGVKDDVADLRWYAFGRFYAQHLTSSEHVWLVKDKLDTAPPLQSEKATALQEGELRHTHLLLHSTYLLYCALMDRVGHSSSGPHGIPIPSRRLDNDENRSTFKGVEDPQHQKAAASLEMAAAFLHQEIPAYAKEWVTLGCQLTQPPQRTMATHCSPIPPLDDINNNTDHNDRKYGTVQDSDFSDADDNNVNSGEFLDDVKKQKKQQEKSLLFQMDTLLLLRAHTSDVSFAVEGEGERQVTRVRFASRLEASIPIAESNDDETWNPTEEAPAVTSSTFVRSVHVFQSKMRDGGYDQHRPADDDTLPPAFPTTDEGPSSNPLPATESPGMAASGGGSVANNMDLGTVSALVATERESFFSSLSTADMVLQLLRYSQEFNARVEERQAHFDYSKMYTQQLDEALAPNAFLVLYGIAAALFGVVVYIVEVLSKVSSEHQDKYTAFEVYQCIFFKFVNTTTFPTLLVDIFARADNIARNPSGTEDDNSFFGWLLPMNLLGKGHKRKKAALVDRESRRSFTHRAKSIASDKLLLITLLLFSPPLITHIVPGCVLYSWLLITPIALFFGFESWISTRLEAYDASFTASSPAVARSGISIPSLAAGCQLSAVQVEESVATTTASEAFLPVMRTLEEGEANRGILTRIGRSMDPTTAIFIVRSLLRVLLIFLLMVVISASFTYMAVYAYADSPLVAQPPDTGLYGSLYGGVTTYERTGSYSKTSYLGAIATDYRGRSIDCILETILTKFSVMIQTGLVSIF